MEKGSRLVSGKLLRRVYRAEGHLDHNTTEIGGSNMVTGLGRR